MYVSDYPNDSPYSVDDRGADMIDLKWGTSLASESSTALPGVHSDEGGLTQWHLELLRVVEPSLSYSPSTCGPAGMALLGMSNKSHDLSTLTWYWPESSGTGNDWLFDLGVDSAEPGSLYASLRPDYLRRLKELELLGGDDGVVINRASERDFWDFLQDSGTFRKGDIVLLDNGNLRAIWRQGPGEHFGLEFVGAGILRYVIFKKRASEGIVSRVAGSDSFIGVKKQLVAFDLFPMLSIR